MTDSPPTPPKELDEEVVATVDSYSPRRLRTLVQYLEQLAEYRESEAISVDRSNRHSINKTLASDSEEVDEEVDEEAGESSDEESESPPEDRPSGVPSKATLTVKEINDNRYYYWQWREGDTIKSKYERPVDKAE